jgi:hypothetical protein
LLFSSRLRNDSQRGLAHCDFKDENVFIRDNWAYLGQLYWPISKEEEFHMQKSNEELL